MPSAVNYIPNTTGRHFVGDNNAHVETYGSCETIPTSVENGSMGCQWQTADVPRALHSVAKVTVPKSGAAKQDVLFDNAVCVVVPLGAVKEIFKKIKIVMRCERQGDLYTAELSMSSFQQPGQGA